VILSGVYFGDRGAPTSSCAAMTAAITNTDHYGNVRRMLKTGALPILITLLINTLFSLRNPITRVDEVLMTALSTNFRFSWLLVLPAVIMLVLPLLRLPIRLCMGLSALAAFLLTVFLQQSSLTETLRAALFGYQPAGDLSAVLSGGGLFSMVPTMLLLLFAGGCTAIIDGLKLLAPAQKFFTKLSGKVGRFPAMCLASLLSCMVFCNQAVAIVFCKELMGKSYPADENAREELASDISCSVTVIASLVPWCISVSVPLTMLGAGFDAIAYSCYLYLVPICYLFTKRLFFPVSESSK